jgi:hypothetical protein
MNDLHGWLYASECILPQAWAAKAVEDIVAKSVPRNASAGVTGALLFTGARFVQFLEGPGASVDTIRRGILADQRHDRIVTLQAGPRIERIFRQWSLAYAGPSLFVADRVDALLDAGLGDIAEMIMLLEEFVIEQAGKR